MSTVQRWTGGPMARRAAALNAGREADMADERGEMARNTLFLAVTRPALWAGIPIEAAVPILLVSAIVLIGTNNPVYALVTGAVCYGLARMVVRQDVNAFRLMFLFFRTKAANRN